MQVSGVVSFRGPNYLFAVKYIPVRVQIGDLEHYALGQAQKIAADIKGFKCPKAIEIVRTEAIEKKGYKLSADSVKCEMTSREVRISLDFTIPIDFIIYRWEYKVDKTVVAPKI